MIAASIALVWAAILFVIAIACRVRARPPAPRAPPRSDLRVLVIRPCAGAEPFLEENLFSLSLSLRSFSTSCVIAIADVSDGAEPAARRAARRLENAGIGAALLVTHATLANAKADQLERVTAAFDCDVLLVADSDVDLAGADLDPLVAPLANEWVGAVWAPPVEHEAQSFGDRASRGVLTASLHSFPLLARLDPGGFVGKLCAIRSDALESIGGFAALAGHLGEDVELGRRLAAAGYDVEVAPVLAIARPASRSFAVTRARYGRWLRVVRAQRGLLLASYPALFFATPLVVLTAIAGASAAPLLAGAAITLSLGTRAWVAVLAARASGRLLGGLWLDAALADLVLALATFDALTFRSFVWRGRALTLDASGRLALAEPEANRDG